MVWVNLSHLFNVILTLYKKSFNPTALSLPIDQSVICYMMDYSQPLKIKYEIKNKYGIKLEKKKRDFWTISLFFPILLKKWPDFRLFKLLAPFYFFVFHPIYELSLLPLLLILSHFSFSFSFSRFFSCLCFLLPLLFCCSFSWLPNTISKSQIDGGLESEGRELGTR